MRWVASAILGLCLASAAITVADARPGGGSTYSGGSHSYSGGSSYRSSSSSGGGRSSGGTADTAVLAFAVIVALAFFLLVVVANNDKARAWNSPASMSPATRTDLRPLIAKDPAFSQVVFEDFAFQLYARAHRARGKPAELAVLAPYLVPGVLDNLARSAPVQAVVIGSLRVIRVAETLRGDVEIDVRIEANLAGWNGTSNVIEKWTFSRKAGVLSRTPDRMRTFPCPNCNAPWSAGSSPRTCAHCGTEIAPGRFEWTVTATVLGASTSVGATLTGTVAEVGTNLPTVVEHDAFTQMQALYESDHNVSWQAFEAHVLMTYVRLNLSWNAGDLVAVRGLVTQALLGYLQYWLDEYKRQKLANKLEGATISRVQLAKVLRDAAYDAVTVRVFAAGFDYTIDAAGTIVGGSKTTSRAYSEYWTFIRLASRRGPVMTAPNCPNCGAPLAISDAGACTHCNAEVESGAFDWVLSKIEQDEVYAG